jgi:hypothetical protein
LPAIQNDRPPDTVLRSESGEFLVVRAENIVAVGWHS